MKISYAWLQTYFPEPLPEPKEVARLLTFHSFEVEGFAEVGSDVVFDVAVLPNRAHDALSHWSIAWELGVLLGGQRLLPFLKKEEEYKKSSRALSVAVEDTALCPRYTGRVVEGVTVGEAPAWLKQHLESIGQRSINAAVDAANYVMFAIGQPMHVFDADKIVGNTIIVRKAKEGERITTLDGKDVALDPSVLVIADTEGPLAIAGIKGGRRAEVDRSTKNIIIEAANFHGTNIRKTAKKLNLRTDASVRFEHELSAHLVEPAMKYMTQLLVETTGGPETSVAGTVDLQVAPEPVREISVTAERINHLLGTKLSTDEIDAILNRIGIYWKPGYLIQVPPTRLDLQGPVDIVEEIGRFYGYEHLKGELLPKVGAPVPLKSYYYAEFLRAHLSSLGFSENYGYSFAPEGEVELMNPLQSDKAFLRTTLAPTISERLSQNTKNKDILELDEVRLFEIGTTYFTDKEETHLVLASSNKKTKLAEALPWPVTNLYKGVENIVEINFTELIKGLLEPVSFSELPKPVFSAGGYAPYPLFPFVARDVAVFVPVDTPLDAVAQLISERRGELCVKGPRLFDTFTKTFPDGTQKASFGFRLVFQSPERTLTNEEVNLVMEGIYTALNAQPGWQVR